MRGLRRTAEWLRRVTDYGLIGRSGRSSISRLIQAGLAAMILGLAYGGTAQANTITVYSLIDPGAAGTCSLRDAIMAANTKKAVHACAKGNGTDTIVFAAGLSGGISLSSALPAIVNTLTIQGTATSPPAITISGQDEYQIFAVNSGATLNLYYLTVTGGVSGNGGAIANGGTLTVANSTIEDSLAIVGGGIYTTGTLTVANSTFYGNIGDAGADGGGAIYNFSGTLTVINSTFANNFGGDSGAIYVGPGATATVVNATFDGNGSSGVGGGAAIDVESAATLNIASTILGDSLTTTPTSSNCSFSAGATITDEGYNLSDDNSCSFTAAGSENNVSTLDLGSLQFNGGPTQTISIDNGSAAYNLIPAGPTGSCNYVNINPCTNPPTSSASGQLVCDQRGVTRPQTTNCDAGAYELQTTNPLAAFNTGLIVFPLQFAAGGSFTLGADATFDPSTQPVTVTISSASFGPLSVTIPPSSFTLVGTRYKYSGTIGGINYGGSFSAPVNGVYQFTFAAFGVDVTGITNPVTVTLQVGPNIGTDDDVAAAIL
jgi:hypothetical protein